MPADSVKLYVAVLSKWTIFLCQILLFCKIYWLMYRIYILLIYRIVVSENEAFSTDDSARYKKHDLGMNIFLTKLNLNVE